MKYIWNNSYIWTVVVDQSEEWSSQQIFQFKQLERRSLKKSRLQRDSNPWPPRYRCDALPTELWSHTLGARPIYWVHISREEWNDVKYIWNNSYIWTAVVDQSEEWSSQQIFQFKQLERRSLKKSRLQRDSHPWPLRYRCDALPTEPWFFQASSFQLLKLENLLRWSFFTLIYNRSSNIWIISYILHIISLLTGDMNSINWPRSQCVAS